MTVQAQLADGRILEFPDGTDPAVVQSTVKRVLSEGGGVPASGGASPPAVGAPGGDSAAGAPTSRDIIAGQLAQGRETLSQENIGEVLGMAAPIAGGVAAAQALSRAPMALRLGGAGSTAAVGDVAQQAGESIAAQQAGGEPVPLDPSRTRIAGALAGGGQAVGELLPTLVPSVIKGIFRGGERGRKTVQQAVDDLVPFGETPSLAVATERPVLDVAETFTSRFPGGRAPIQRAVERTTQNVGDVIERETQALAGGAVPDPELAGQSIAQGLKGFAGRLSKRSERAFGFLNRLIDPAGPVQVNNTLTTLDDLTRLTPGAERTSGQLVNPKIQRIREGLVQDAANGQVPFAALQELRTQVGRKLTNTSLVDDVPRAEWKRIYGALTEDMRAAAKATSPAAEQAFEKANNFYKTRISRVNKFLDPLAKKDEVEKIFLTLESGARSGPTKLRETMKSLNLEQRKVLAGALARRMGKAIPSEQGAEGGEFSFNTFLRNWNTFDKSAKEVAFKAVPGMRANLDQIARTADRIKRSSKAFRNPPETAGALVAQGLTVGAAAAAATGNPLFLGGLIGLGVMANGAGRMMTNPSFVRWLAQSTKVKPAGVPAHIGRLAGIAAAADDETKQDIQEFLGTLREQPSNTPPKEVSRTVTERP